MLKLLKTLSLLIVITACSSCGRSGLPNKPTIESGIVILDTNEVFFINNQTGQERSEPIVLNASCDLNPKLGKNIVHSNEDWNLLLLYVRLLERRVPSTIRYELKKLRETTERINEKTWRKP